MTQQGSGWPQDPYATGGAQPPASGQQGYPQQPPAYQQPTYPQQPAQPGYPAAPAYQQQGYPAAPAYQQPGYPAAPAYGYQQGYGYGQPLPPLAHWGKRVGAYVIDQLMTTVPIGLGALIMTSTLETTGYNYYTGEAITEPNGAGLAAMFLGYLAALGIAIWNRWIRQGKTGRSVGKQVLGITLVAELTGQPIGAGKAFLRDLCHVVDGFFYLGYLWPLWDAKRQTFSDKILGTVVLDG